MVPFEKYKTTGDVQRFVVSAWCVFSDNEYFAPGFGSSLLLGAIDLGHLANRYAIIEHMGEEM